MARLSPRWHRDLSCPGGRHERGEATWRLNCVPLRACLSCAARDFGKLHTKVHARIPVDALKPPVFATSSSRHAQLKRQNM